MDTFQRIIKTNKINNGQFKENSTTEQTVINNNQYTISLCFNEQPYHQLLVLLYVIPILLCTLYKPIPQ